MSTTDQTMTATDQITALGNAMHPVSEWPQPKFPEPVDAPVPAWATRVYPWLWVTIDDVWQRVMKRPFHWADAGGFDIDVTQEVSADGTVTTPPPEIMVDLDHDTIDNAADARQFGQWLIEAAEIMEAGDDPEAVLAAAHRHAADAIRPFMPGLAREFDAEGGVR